MRARALTGLLAASVVAACSAPAAPVAPSSTARPSSAPSTPSTPSTPGVAERAARPSLVLGEDSVFRQDVTRAPVDPASPALVRTLLDQIASAYDGHVVLNAHQYGTSLYVATASTPRVRIAFDDCQHKGAPPAGLYDGPAHFVDVPVPDDARPSEGTDAALSVWSPADDALWELWVARRRPDGGWSACWGGRLDHVSQSTRGAFPVPFGASASGLATIGTAVSVAEARAGRIDHAVQLGLPAPRARDAAYPANRTDGSADDPAALPLGTRLRLPASVDVETLGLTPLGAAVARAAQRYGFLVTETAGAVSVSAESPNAALSAGRPDPWPAILGTTPEWDVLAGFPWSRLEVVRLGYGAPPGTAPVVRLW